MTWYYHSGKTVRPIPVKPGLSKAVRPHSKVEILEMTAEAQALIRKGQLRVTGKPKGAKSVADEPVPGTDIAGKVKLPVSARSIAEKGKTTSATMPPVSSSAPQMTEGELAQAAADKKKAEEEAAAAAPANAENVENEEKPAESGEEVDQAEVLSDDNRNKGSRKRRRK